MAKVSPILKALSYLAELTLESSSSEINPFLEISISKGRLKLNTKNATYSFEDKYTVYTESLEQINDELKGIKRVLLLGYGIGSIKTILNKKHGLFPEIVGIERDPEVIRLAEKWTVAENVELIQADAFEYLKGSAQKFDLICSDIFIDQYTPQEFRTNEYLEALKEHLDTNGILLYNCLAMTEEFLMSCNKFYESKFKRVLPDSKIIITRFNRVFYYKKR